MTPRHPPPFAGLEVDIDTRIAGMWEVVWGSTLLSRLDTPKLRDELGVLLRTSYSLGYRDALVEVSEGQPGELLVRHNVRLT